MLFHSGAHELAAQPVRTVVDMRLFMIHGGGDQIDLPTRTCLDKDAHLNIARHGNRADGKLLAPPRFRHFPIRLRGLFQGRSSRLDPALRRKPQLGLALILCGNDRTCAHKMNRAEREQENGREHPEAKH